MFVAAIAAGATSMGVDVHIVGVVPTPALAFIAGHGPFAAGIMVSASHNPAPDNGLKVLDGDGLKLDDSVEDELERLDLADRGAARRPERGARPDGRRHERARRLPGAPARPGVDDRCRRPAPGARRGERIRLGGRAARSSTRPAPGSTSSMPIRTASTSTSASGATAPASLAEAVVAARRRRRVRARWRRRPADRGRRHRAGRRWRPGPRDPRPRPAEPRRRCRAAGWSSRSSPTAGSRPSSRRPAARSSARRSATSTSSRGCRCRAPSSAARRAAT